MEGFLDHNGDGMRAIVYDKYGSPEVLRVEEVEAPRPKAHELLVRVHASEVTKTDCEIRSFKFAVMWFWFPLRLALGIFRPRRRILGMYFAGEVIEKGPGTTKYPVGARLFGSCQLSLGGHGQLVCIKESSPIAKIPESLSYEAAASLPLGGFNALHFMRLAEIQEGQKVLVVGAGGSIGAHAVQIACSEGARVTAVDAPHKETKLREWGAAEFINYQTTHFWERSERYDVVFGLIPSIAFSRFVSVLKPGGLYLLGNPKLSDMLRVAWVNRFTNYRASFRFAEEKPEDLDTLGKWLDEGRIERCLDRTYTMEEIQEAHRRVDEEERVGCVVLRLPS